MAYPVLMTSFKLVSVRSPRVEAPLSETTGIPTSQRSQERPKGPRYLNLTSFMSLVVVLLAIVAYRSTQESGASVTKLAPPRPLPEPEVSPYVGETVVPVVPKPEVVASRSLSRREVRLVPEIRGLVDQQTLNLNTKARFPNSTEDIVCRHLSLSVLQDVGPNGEVDLRPYASVAGIMAHVPADAEAQYNAIERHAPEVHMVATMRFGSFLVEQLMAMVSENNALKKMYLSSVAHAMGLWLTVDTSGEKPMYGVHVYDPNFTVIYKSVVTEDVSKLRTLTLRSFVKNAYDTDGGGLSVCTLFVLPDPSVSRGTEVERRLTRHAIPFSGTVLYHLLNFNFPQEIATYLSELSDKNISEGLLTQLGARPGGEVGLFQACGKNYPHAVLAYLQGLGSLQLSGEQLLYLASGKKEDNPSLATAMSYGHKEVILAYFQGLKFLDLSPEQLVYLVESKQGVVPGLSIAIVKNHKEAIVVYFQGLKSLGLPPDQLMYLVESKVKGVSGLHIAIVGNYKEAIVAYFQGLKSLGLSLEQLVYLVGAKSDGLTCLESLLKTNNKECILAYFQGLKSLDLLPEQLVYLVTVKNLGINKNSGYGMSLSYKYKDAETSYIEGIESLGLTSQQITKLQSDCQSVLWRETNESYWALFFAVALLGGFFFYLYSQRQGEFKKMKEFQALTDEVVRIKNLPKKTHRDRKLLSEAVDKQKAMINAQKKQLLDLCKQPNRDGGYILIVHETLRDMQRIMISGQTSK